MTDLSEGSRVEIAETWDDVDSGTTGTVVGRRAFADDMPTLLVRLDDGRQRLIPIRYLREVRCD